MAANPSGAPVAVSNEQAAEQISALLADDPEYREEDQPEAESEEAVEAASEEEDQPEAESIEIDPDEEMFEVEITLEGGEKETRKYSLNQLKKERMLEADYRRKTEEISRQRRDLETERRQGLEKERQEYLQALQTQQKLVMELVVPDVSNLDTLAEDDPAEYLKVQHRLGKINSVLQRITAEQQRIQQQQMEDFQRNVIPAELEKVRSSIPNWNQDVKDAIVRTGEHYGFTRDELNGVWDSRMIRVLHDAQQFRALQSNKEVALKKVVEKPKVMKSGTKAKQGNSEAVERFKKSGRYEDAALLIERML